MEAKNFIRKSIRSLKKYQAMLPGSPVQLHANENPYPTPPELLSAIAQRMKRVEFNKYPDPGAEQIRSKLASRLSLLPENIVLGNGSDELIQMVIEVAGDADGKVLLPYPTFAMYEISAIALGQTPLKISLDEKWDLDLDRIKEAIELSAPKVIFLANPNNPTGNCFAGDKISAILKMRKCITVVDEAYYDFSERSFLDSLDEYDNLIILRSFSKIGLAGLRFGYLIAHEDIAEEIMKVRLPYNVNSLTQAAINVVLENDSLLKKQVESIIVERKWLYTKLLGIDGIITYPSDANFILFRTLKKGGGEICNALLAKGIQVKNLDDGGSLKNCLRVTVGRPDQNRAFVAALTAALGVSNVRMGKAK